MEQTILFVNDTVSARSGETTRLKPFSLYHSDTHRSLPLTIIAAIGNNNEIGKNGNLIWHIPDDLKHFKTLTMGADIIMGRKTWESLPRRPLPGRRNIVISSNPSFNPDGGVKASSIEEAIELTKGNEAFIIGGESVYRAALPLADKLEITHIMESDGNADTWFPEISQKEWELTAESEQKITPEGIKYKYSTYRRI